MTKWLMVMVTDRQTVLSPAYFTAFVNLTDSLQTIPDVANVLGAGNASLPSPALFGAATTPLLEPGNHPQRTQRYTLTDQPTLREQLFSDDYQNCPLHCRLKKQAGF